MKGVTVLMISPTTPKRGIQTRTTGSAIGIIRQGGALPQLLAAGRRSITIRSIEAAAVRQSRMSGVGDGAQLSAERLFYPTVCLALPPVLFLPLAPHSHYTTAVRRTHPAPSPAMRPLTGPASSPADCRGNFSSIM